MDNPATAERKEAWFSATADRLFGSALYRGANGEIVPVTEVVRSGLPVSRWSDLKRVGFVYECIELAPDLDLGDLDSGEGYEERHEVDELDAGDVEDDEGGQE